MALVKNSKKRRYSLVKFAFYFLSAAVFLGPFVYGFDESVDTLMSKQVCFNQVPLCAPILVSNLGMVLSHFNFPYAGFFKAFVPLFIVFMLFWLRIERFQERVKLKKIIAFFVLILNPFTLSFLSEPSVNSYHLLFFLLVSLGYEAINHGMIIRGMIISSSSIAILGISGGVGIILGIMMTTFFYIAVKWHILKKYIFTSFTLLLFPTIGLLGGIYYLCMLYEASYVSALMNENVQSFELTELLKWLIFFPLFLMYRIKDKKGLNVIKKYIVPVFFIAEISFMFLGINYVQDYFLGMCAICVAFEIISDMKFSKTHLFHTFLFGALSWLYYFGLLFIPEL